MKFIPAVVLGLLLAGCCMTEGSRQAPDGSLLKIHNVRFFWASEGVNFTLRDTNGVAVSLALQRSTVDAAALSAVAEGVAKGLATGAH